MRIHLDADMRSVHKRLAASSEVRELIDLIPQKIYLSEKDMEFLIEQLENPPAPNANLTALLKGN